MRVFSEKNGSAPFARRLAARGFTLIELIVVVTIMVAMLALAANMLKGGRGQGLQVSIDLVDSMAQEARLEAISTGSYARLIVVSNRPDAPDANMRTLGILSYDKKRKKWVRVGDFRSFPAGFYVSAKYSTLLEARNMGKNSRSRALKDCSATLDMRGYGKVDYYYVEFDYEGRMSQPSAPTRLVVAGGTVDEFGDEIPSAMTDGKPGHVAGIVIYPKGNMTKMRTEEQIVPKIID